MKKIMIILFMFLFITLFQKCKGVEENKINPIDILDIETSIEKTTATFSWKTNKESVCILSISGKEYSSSGKDHSIVVYNLESNKTYDYSISANILESEPIYSSPSIFFGSIVIPKLDDIAIIDYIEQTTINSVSFSILIDQESTGVFYFKKPEDSTFIEKALTTEDNLNFSIEYLDLNPDTRYEYFYSFRPFDAFYDNFESEVFEIYTDVKEVKKITVLTHSFTYEDNNPPFYAPTFKYHLEYNANIWRVILYWKYGAGEFYKITDNPTEMPNNWYTTKFLRVGYDIIIRDGEKSCFYYEILPMESQKDNLAVTRYPETGYFEVTLSELVP